uniref:Uncharacterized protein n=1 Tax=viral metagenome TaxID=1070528 RepID=A0A6M3K3F4_9ZZZZ
MRKNESRYVEFEIGVRRVKRETKKGVLLVLEPDGIEEWFPKSQVRGDWDLDDEDITLTIPKWLADEKKIEPF